jgi:hypothetical protein
MWMRGVVAAVAVTVAALPSTARAGWDVCSTVASVQSDGEIAPGGWIMVTVSEGEGGCSAEPTLTPIGGGEPLWLASQDGGRWDVSVDWFQVPDHLAPGDYLLNPGIGATGYPIHVGGTVALGAPPAIAATVSGEIVDQAVWGFGGCAEERTLCVEVDAGAPGVPGWAVELARVGAPARTWRMLPAEGMHGRWCMPLSCEPVVEACVELRPVDPAHATGDTIGPLCATIDPAPTGDTGADSGADSGADTGASAEEVSGCGCAPGSGHAVPGWPLVAAVGLASALVRVRRAPARRAA